MSKHSFRLKDKDKKNSKIEIEKLFKQKTKV